MKYIEVREVKPVFNFTIKKEFDNVYSAMGFFKGLYGKFLNGHLKFVETASSLEAESFGSKAVDNTQMFADVGMLVHPLSYCTIGDYQFDDRYGMQKDLRVQIALKKFADECRELFSQICENGFLVDVGGEFKPYRVLTYTVSSVKEDKVIIVPEDKYDALNEALGIREEDFYGQSFADIGKIQALAFAGQEPISNFGIFCGMRNVLVIKNYDYKVLLRNVRNMDLNGNKISFEKEAYKKQKVSDAQGILIAEAFEDDIVRENYAFQIRGKGLKGMLTFGHLFRWAKEKNKKYIKDYFGRVWKIDELIGRGIKCIVTADMLKGNLWNRDVHAWETWCNEGNYSDELWACGYACNSKKLENTIKCSRQHFSTLFGVDEELAGIAAQATVDHLNGIIENGSRISKTMEKLVPGFRKTILGHVLDDAEYRSIHDQAYFARLESEGCFAYVVWEQKPLIASAFCNEDGETMTTEEIDAMRELRGNVSAFGGKAKHKEAIFGRYPTISQAFVKSKLVKSHETCSNVIEASWDLPLSGVLKADTDGDHLAVYLKAIED